MTNSLLILLLSVNLAGAQQMATDKNTTLPADKLPEAAGAKARAVMESKSGSKVSGTIIFEETPAKTLRITYKLKGLNKNQNHGFHVHEKGDCSSVDAKSAGTHFSPVAPTGGTSIETPQKYAGDLPMIKADGQGRAEGSFDTNTISLDADHPVLNRAIILHGGPDDPTKPSAHRFACGQIQAVTK